MYRRASQLHKQLDMIRFTTPYNPCLSYNTLNNGLNEDLNKPMRRFIKQLESCAYLTQCTILNAQDCRTRVSGRRRTKLHLTQGPLPKAIDIRNQTESFHLYDHRLAADTIRAQRTWRPILPAMLARDSSRDEERSIADGGRPALRRNG